MLGQVSARGQAQAQAPEQAAGGLVLEQAQLPPLCGKDPQPSILHQSLHAMVNFWRLTHR